MAKKLHVVISQGQSNNPEKRALEEGLVAALLFEAGVEVAIVPHLYDLSAESTGMLCLKGIAGDLVVASWLYPRAAYWTLHRQGVKGRFGTSLLKVASDEADDEDEADREEASAQAEEQAENGRGVGARDLPNRFLYCLDLRATSDVAVLVREIQRIRSENTVQTVGLMGWIGGQPKAEQLARYLDPQHATPPAPAAMIQVEAPVPSEPAPAANEPVRILEQTGRRWYPVIDFTRCTNCMECLDFCLFGVYGLDRYETILVEQPDNCKKGCPACSRVCPENAIIFPQHKTPSIAGSPEVGTTGLKIDLSKLFGAPDALEIAALERDRELVADGREAVGLSVGIPKRQAQKSAEQPRDALDDLMDKLDDLDL